ncbi:MAG TPA: hypothetical protein VHW09_04965 [Bryobacteraceae bacterium]|jgi:uncharacterized repeat protein (TIGR01451 family)|nr:hypothetical protein [Bryobacteraceae bacterium]
MMPGTYSGQVVFAAGGVTSLTVPVTLVIQQSTATFFDNMPGQISFSTTAGGQPPPQTMQIRNGGTGTLNWTVGVTTFDSGNWIGVSANSGTAPGTLTISLKPGSLPSGGMLAGTYGAMLTFQNSDMSSTVSVPIGVTVASNAFDQVNALSYTKPYTGKDPLPQTVMIATVGAVSNFSVTAYDANGSATADWLSASPSGNCCSTHTQITISTASQVTQAAGTYTGEVVVDNGVQTMVIPVYLTIAPPTVDFFDNPTGALNFSLSAAPQTPPPAQLLQIRNAGTGTLNWTLSVTTFDSGNWLTVSDMGDAAPSQIAVGITVANLPNSGLVAGMYTANLLFQSDNSSVTVPITVQVGGGFGQVNPLSFTMVQTGKDPLPQNISITSLGSTINFSAEAYTATGGSWLTVTPSGNCCSTPETLQVAVTAPVTQAAGVYTGQVIVNGSGSSVTVPVTLTIAPAGTASYLDNLPGELSFSMQTAPTNPPPAQVVQIRNAGSGTLNWTLIPETADGAAWLNVSATNGTAPETISVSITPGNLPNGGLIAGVFVGQLLIQTNGSSVSIPVKVNVGTNVFQQHSGLNFTMVQNGPNPLPQVLTANSTSSAINFSVTPFSATGGSWLLVSPSGNCCSTSEALVVSVSAPSGMSAGIYSGEVSLVGNGLSEMVPVTLTVASPNTPFFDNVPGGFHYSLTTASGNPPPQLLQVRNRGIGSLNWTAQTFTADGANWLTISSNSGTAPSQISVGIVTSKLPNGGLVAGIFTGEVLLLSGETSSVSIPISVQVGGNGFQQTNPLDFTMPLNGANPLPQFLTISSIGSAVNFSVASYDANGGDWLDASPSGNCCSTSEVSTVSVTAPTALAAGTYTGEVIYNRTTTAMVVPVNLTVAPPTASFFDSVQGQLGFFAATGATPATQTLYIQGQGVFGLGWTLTATTADSGNWLTVSAMTGTAPSNVIVGINIANLPNQGLVAGEFTGQLLFQSTGGGSVTVPVSVLLGTKTFTQLSPLNFSMAYAGSNPLSQVVNVTSGGTNSNYTVTSYAGSGGSWLSTSPSGNCCTTPENITFTANGSPGTPKVPVPAGIHIGETVFNASSFAMTLPVILTVNGTPIWSIAKTHTGNFNAGQANATYAITVSNQSGAGVGSTSGTVTVTDTVPAGMTLVSMAGTGWTCPAQGITCTRSDGLGSGQSYPPITVTVNVTTTSLVALTNQASVSGGGATAGAAASDATAIITRCDVNQDGMIGITDLQSLIEQALGILQASNDLNTDGTVSLVDVQLAVAAALNNTCQAM